MKQLTLLVFCTIWLLSAVAQSQMITGTLLPKNGASVVYLPKAANSKDSSKKNIDTVPVIKPLTLKSPAKKLKATKTPFDNKGFKFQMPVVQGQKANDGQPETVVPNIAKVPVETTKPLSPVLQNTKNTPLNTANAPLKYEEPPINSTNINANINKNDETSPQLKPLVYSAPPSENGSTNNQSTNTNEDANASALKSPIFKGEYKATIKQPILLVPVAANQLENGMLKTKSTELPSSNQNTVEAPKTLEDLYPPLNYIAPPSIATANLKSPKIEGTYVATKNNPQVLVPVPSDASLTNQEPPQNIFDNATSKASETNNQALTISNTRTAQVSESSIFDVNSRNLVKSPLYISPEKQVSKTKLAIKTKSAVKNTSTKYNKFQKPVKQSINKTSTPILPTYKPTPKSTIGKFLKPVKQSMNANSNTSVIKKNAVENITQQTGVQQANTGYKFYLNTSGKYNISFEDHDNTILVSSFGRIVSFTQSPTANSIKPTYNYKGLLETVGDVKIQYTYEGRVAAVGTTQIAYNYDGAIEKVGNTPIYYNYNGTVDKIGNSKVAYNEKSNIISLDKNDMILVKQ